MLDDQLKYVISKQVSVLWVVASDINIVRTMFHKALTTEEHSWGYPIYFYRKSVDFWGSLAA